MKSIPTQQGRSLLLLMFLMLVQMYSIAQSHPGGVNGAVVWLKGDQGVITNGNNVTTWVNQTGGTNFSGKGNPQLVANNLNFHPGIVFNGTNSLLSNANLLTNNGAYTKFFVFKYDGNTPNNIVSSGVGGSHAVFGQNTSTDLILHHNGNILTAGDAVNNTRYFLGTAGFNSSQAGGTYINANGVTKAAMTSAALYQAGPIQLGAHHNGNNLTGRLAEVVVYPSALGSGANATRQVQSYLGIKYGITLGHNYLTSNATVAYDISNFPNNIAGLGRDDNSSLNQKQGRSNNPGNHLVMALGAVAASNAANANSFASSGQYLVWGDNNGALNTTTTLTGYPNVSMRVSRIWKLQNTGAFNQQVTVYYPTASLNGLPGNQPYLIYGNSATLAAPGTEVAASGKTVIEGLEYTAFQVTFPATGVLYFSFGAKLLHPGNVTGAAVWLRADAGVNFSSGSTVDTWYNQMNAANSFVAAGTPTLVAGHANLQSSVAFNGASYLSSQSNVLNGNSPYTKFIVFKYDGGATPNNLVSSTPGGNIAFWGSSTNTDLALWHQGNILNAAGAINTNRYFMGTGGFTRNLAAGTYINVDGVNRGTVNSASTYVTGGVQLGSHSNNSGLTGRIAEVIVYPSSLGNNSLQTRKIQTYLALKYGITAGHDYIASDGTTIAYTLAGFGSNIAGIGRDDNTALYQKQGRSGNPGAQVLIAAGTGAATNAANTAVLPTDNQFLVWGDNNGSLTATTTLAGWTNVSVRLNRIWKLQNTNGFNQQVTVYFPLNNLNYLPGTYPYLMYSNSAAFTTGTEVTPGSNVTIAGVLYKSYTVNFPATGELYFTFGAKTIFPANVSGANLWVRPDAGLISTGTNVTSWVNQMSTANSFTGTGNPQKTPADINFNNGVVFSGGNYLTTSGVVTTANSNYTKFVVFKYDALGTNNFASGGNGNSAFYGNNTTTDVQLFHAGRIAEATGAVNTSRYFVATGAFASGVANGTYINIDGTVRDQVTSSAPHTAATLQLGAYNNAAHLNGRVAEAIVYPVALATGSADTRKIQTYLGLKYGITMGHNYLTTDGTVAYAVTSHNLNIAGIGRDDAGGLNQLQSTSINSGNQVVISTGSIAASNEENNTPINADKQYLVWGNDNGAINTTSAVTGYPIVNNRFTRVWKLENTGSFNQQVTVYFPTAALNLLTNATKYLIYSTSATLASPGTEVAASTAASINGVAHTGFVLTFPNTGTLYFSFASKAVNPGAVSGAAMWVRGDAGVEATGTTVSNWINQMNTSNNFAATGPVEISSNAVNFNPAVVFNGSNYLTSAANISTSATGNYTKFVVFRLAPGGANNLLSGLNAAGSAFYSPNSTLSVFHTGPLAASPSRSVNPGNHYLGTAVFNYGVTNGTFPRVNGTTSNAVTSSTNHAASRMQLGAYQNNSFLSAGSNIAEAIMYNAALAPADYQKVESYLALKYGITLSYNYQATDATVTYDVAGYGSNIAGIGRDENTGLHQRQSKSINPGAQVVMALSEVAASNEENPGNITSDLQFLVWGDNDAAGYFYNTGISQKRLAKTWKLQNTNSFNQSVTVYYPLTGLHGLGNNPQLIYGNFSSLDNGSATKISAGTTVTIKGEEFKAFTVTFPATGTLYFSFAGEIVPEICGNGIDDDLNEYTDDLDANCSPVPGCTTTAPPLTGFSITQEWVSSISNALAASVSPTVADLDGDGMPEIIAARAGGAGLTVFKGNGSNAGKNTVDYNIQLPQRVNQSTVQTAVADIDRDGIPEVISIRLEGPLPPNTDTIGYVYVFNNVSGNATTYKFRSEEKVNPRFVSGSPRVVDINEDGIPEIVVGLDVFQFNFAEGKLIKAVAGSYTAPAGKDFQDWGADVVVIDILASNPGKEIVAGSKVYGVDLTTGTTTVLADLSTITGGTVPASDDGPTAVADLDFDGNLDIAYPNGTHIVIWDPTAGALKMRLTYPNNSSLGRGMPTIANVYNEKTIDGKPTDLPEVIFNCRNYMHAYNLNNLTGPVWSLATADNSAETGVTAFDLNGDGIQEIIYNDEALIRVINGNLAAPVNVATFTSGTATWMEHPIVVDVDNDGSAEFVCVSALPSSGNLFVGALRVFGATPGTSAWQNTRKIWSGRGYRSKSINDDLSIPVKEQSITLQYPAGSGKFPLDVFNCQVDARILNPGLVAASDLYVSDLKMLKSETACEFTPGSASLVFTISNNGSAAAPAGTPMRFYLGDPRVAGAIRLGNVRELAQNLAVGASVTDTVTLNLSAYTAPYNVFAVMNDDGSAAIPFNLPIASSSVKECDNTNNHASLLVSPMPADFGNLGASWPAAIASIFTSDAAWMGNNAPNAECASDENDAADGLVMNSGAITGSGTKASPWKVQGIGTVCNFTLTVNGNGAAKPVYWAAWYDVDANGSFTDPTDLFVTGNTMHGSPATTTFSFTVPGAMGATNGTIRVIAAATDPSFTQDMNGTGTFINGEVEDFYISYIWPLPVTLTSFGAFPSGNCEAKIKWATSMEEHSSHYEIEYSTNSIDFRTIATVRSSNKPHGDKYTYNDSRAAEGKCFYRLKMVDFDGKAQYSAIATVQSVCSNVEIKLSPNPVKGMATITGLKGGERLKVYGADGKVEMEMNASGSVHEMNFRNLPAGVHLVQVIRNGVTVAQLKVTKL